MLHEVRRACQSAANKNIGIVRIEGHVDASGVLIFVENFLPGLAAIGRAENTALGVRSVGMAERGHENDVRIVGIDDDFADGAAVAQANVLPGLASVERFVNSIAVRDVSANAGLACTHVNRVVIGVGHGEAANGSTSLFIENRRPGHGAVGRLPDAAAGRAEIIGRGIAGNSGCSQRAPATERADHAILHAFEKLVFRLAGIVFAVGIVARRRSCLMLPPTASAWRLSIDAPAWFAQRLCLARAECERIRRTNGNHTTWSLSRLTPTKSCLDQPCSNSSPRRM